MLFNGLEQPTPIPYLFIRLRDYFSCEYEHFLDWLFHFFGSHEVFSCSIVTYIKKKRTASIVLVFFVVLRMFGTSNPNYIQPQYLYAKELLQRETLSYI